MKTIEQMWEEYADGVLSKLGTGSRALDRVYTMALRSAFFAGFNRCYNSCNDILSNPNYSEFVSTESGGFTIYPYESEMDAHTDELDKEKE